MKKYVLFFLTLILYSSIGFSQETKEKEESFEEIIWHVKAYMPELKFLKVKAIDKDGNIHDVKAIQNSEQTSIMDVKAFVNGKRLPIKMLVDGGKYYGVKAIDDDGTIIDIKAITDNGDLLPVKGVSQSGNIVHIRAIYEDMIYYNVVAISPNGKTNAVKGVKMNMESVETTVNGVQVFAHIKAIPQAKY
jgi:hypothetical protein